MISHRSELRASNSPVREGQAFGKFKQRLKDIFSEDLVSRDIDGLFHARVLHELGSRDGLYPTGLASILLKLMERYGLVVRQSDLQSTLDIESAATHMAAQLWKAMQKDEYALNLWRESYEKRRSEFIALKASRNASPDEQRRKLELYRRRCAIVDDWFEKRLSLLEG